LFGEGLRNKKGFKYVEEFVGKCRFSSGPSPQNLGICPAPGIQEPRWPWASKNLWTPLACPQFNLKLLYLLLPRDKMRKTLIA